MNKPLHTDLSRRERQIMDIIYRLEEASVADILLHMPDDAVYDSVRVTLRILEKKGYVKHRREKKRYLYTPVTAPETATRSAVRHLLKTFFGGSPSRAILTLLDMSAARLSKEERAEIVQWIENADKETE